MDRTERIEQLRRAIHRYKHLLKGGEIDYDATLRIEEVELDIMDEIRKDKELVRYLRDSDLNLVLSKFYDKIIYLIEKVSRRMQDKTDNPHNAYKAFLTGDTTAQGFRSAFIVIQAIARLKAEYFEEQHGNIDHQSPVCPVCGAISRTMTIDEGQKYQMVCPFCGYKWTVSKKRLVCPYCGNTDALSLGIFTGKKAKRLGLAWCQKCGSTWRVVMDTSIRVPRLLLPVIAHGAEVYRSLLPVSGGAAIVDPFKDA